MYQALLHITVESLREIKNANECDTKKRECHSFELNKLPFF
jgi:hypothetical protein